MAILEHFSACVLVDGQPCQEYAADEDEEQDDENLKSYPRVVKYVEAVPGAYFAIRIQPTKAFSFKAGSSLRYEYFADGKWIDSDVLLKYQIEEKEVSVFDAIPIGDACIRRLKFGDVKIRETKTADRSALLSDEYADLGTIAIEIWLCKCDASFTGNHREIEEATDAIPEAAVKGDSVSVQASFGDSEPEVCTFDYYTTEKLEEEPLAEFCFKCRTKEDLQRISIIPRPRSPTPLEERPPESLTRDELLELVRRKKVAEEASRVKIKQEKKEANLRELAAIKRSRDEAEDDDETIEVTTVLKKKRTEPTNVIGLD